MAFGSGRGGDPGEWSQKPPARERREVEVPEPPAQPPPPPKKTAPPVLTTPGEEVTPETIARDATNLFPSNEEARKFSDWRTEKLQILTDQIIKNTDIDLEKFSDEMMNFDISMQKIVDELNKKNVVEPSVAKPCPELPGSCKDPTCQSLFDVNELAIRGRKAVTAKRFYFPVIYPDFLLDHNQQWGLGQKVEFDQEWRHEGFTLGGLISSFSLLPNEEVTVEVSSWQRTKSEIQQEKDDATRSALEQELRRTDEQTIANETANENGWTVSATAGFSYGPVCASVNAGENGSSSERINQARQHVQESTTRAASEVSSRRSIKITHTTESQTEQKSVRRMKNPNQCHTVTFNYFQVIKLIDVQMRFINDAPVLYFPGLFPAAYTNGKTVRIPYEVIESFTAPALFLTQYFAIDRDLSQEIHGFALRIRADVGRAPAEGLRAITEALIVATKTLLRLEPDNYANYLTIFARNYVKSAITVRRKALETYGIGNGKSLQVNTSGIYVDSLLGRCSACEDAINAERYVDIQRTEAERQQIDSTNQLVKAEVLRRQRLLDEGILTNFEVPATPTPS